MASDQHVEKRMMELMAKRRTQVVTFFAGALAVVSFFILSSIAVVWANGLRFNPDTKRFEQTVVVAVESKQNYNDLAVYLNGERVGEEVPFQKRGLVPGQYELTIQKAGFQPWRQVFNLSANEVGLVKEFQLIAVSPKISQPAGLSFFVEPYFDTGLTLSTDGELIDGNTLVSRFVVQPKLARRFGSGYLYQLEKQLRLFVPEGPQDYLIYTLADSAPAHITIHPADWQIAVQENNAVKLIELTVPQS